MDAAIACKAPEHQLSTCLHHCWFASNTAITGTSNQMFVVQLVWIQTIAELGVLRDDVHNVQVQDVVEHEHVLHSPHLGPDMHIMW